MKKNLILFILLAVLLPATAVAYDIYLNGIYYNINGNEVTVTSSGTSNINYSGSVIIPSFVTYGSQTYTVTSIGNRAFYMCKNLTSITIPSSVTSIGNSAFSDCNGLTGIEIPNSVTSIGEWAFSSCIGLTSVSIPNSVTSIGDSAFQGCSGLSNIEIPNSVFYIGGSAFDGTLWLENQPDGLIYIGLVAYKYKGVMPEGTSLTIADGTLGIAGSAFYGCSGLTSISIPNSVVSIGSTAFHRTSWLEKQPDGVVYAGLVAYEYKGDMPEGTSITLEEGTLGIASGAFFLCGNLKSVTIPNSVTNIGGWAFTYCYGLTNVIIGSSVTTIGDNAFFDCQCLTSLYCLALAPPIVEYNTFSDYYGATLYVPDISVDIYQSTNWTSFTNIVGMPYTFQVDGVSYRASTMNAAKVIAKEEDYYAGNVLIPDTVTFGGQTFAVTEIEGNAFDGCYDITSVVIPNSLETIGEQAFQGCTGLTTMTIGSGVTSIGTKAFNYCNALATIKCLGKKPPVMTSSDCFTSATYNRAQLLVPRNSLDNYKGADYWSKFANIDGWGSIGPGDINGDGIISISDVTTLIDVILGVEIEIFEDIYFESADLNSNGRLDIGDVTTIIDNLINGK